MPNNLFNDMVAAFAGNNMNKANVVRESIVFQ